MHLAPHNTHTQDHRSTRNMDRTMMMMMMASSAILLLLAVNMAESQPVKNNQPTHGVRDKNTTSNCLKVRGEILHGTYTPDPDKGSWAPEVRGTPKCDGRGQYDPRQNHNGTHWCVDPVTGDEVEPYDVAEDGKLDCVGHVENKQQTKKKQNIRWGHWKINILKNATFKLQLVYC